MNAVKNALESLRGFLRNLAEGYRLRRQLKPDVFKSLTRELRELTRLASIAGPLEDDFQERVQRIEGELRQLEKLTGKPEFHRLSASRRLLLHQSLVHHRKQLLDAVRHGPAPTEFLQ